MAVKLSTLTFSKRIPRWVCFNSSFSSLCDANSIQTTPETPKDPNFTSDFEAKIQFLKNNLHPNSLTHVLDSTNDANSSLKLFKWVSLQERFKHNADTYCRIILKLGMAGNIEEMEGYCNEMIKERCVGSGEALLGLLDYFVRYRRLDEALRVLFCVNSTSFKPNIDLFNELMGAVVEEKKGFKDVLFVYKEMVKAGIVPNVDTVNYLLEALFESGRVDTALDQYKRMKKKGCNPNSKTFEIVVSRLVACDRVDESLLVIDEMIKLGVELDLKFYRRVVPLFCRMNNLEVAMKLFRMMSASRVLPDSSTYGIIIQCLCHNLQVYDAINIFDEMMDGGLVPDDDVLVDVVNGLCKLNKLDEAKKFLEDRNIVNTCAHNVLVGAYCDAGKFLVAKDLFDEMFDRNITDSLSWNTIIGYLCANAGIKKAMGFLSRMIISSFVPDSITYSSLIVGKCKSGESKDAFMFFRQVLAKSWVLDSVSYAELIVCLCQRDKIQEAAEVFCYMSGKQCSLQSFAFDMLIAGVCDTGIVCRAIKLLSLAHYSGTCCSCTSYKCIIPALAKSGNEKDLLIMLSRILVDGCSLDGEMYRILLQSMVEIGHTRECALIFNLMLNEGLLPDSETLANLLTHFAKPSQLHALFSAIDEHVCKCKILDSATYSILINGLWKEGYKTRACQLLDKMLEEGWVPDATTHALLMGRDVLDKTTIGKLASKDFILPDEVSSILAEGLGNILDQPDQLLLFRSSIG